VYRSKGDISLLASGKFLQLTKGGEEGREGRGGEGGRRGELAVTSLHPTLASKVLYGIIYEGKLTAPPPSLLLFLSATFVHKILKKISSLYESTENISGNWK
jgi:hypothetical protein